MMCHGSSTCNDCAYVRFGSVQLASDQIACALCSVAPMHHGTPDSSFVPPVSTPSIPADCIEDTNGHRSVKYRIIANCRPCILGGHGFIISHHFNTCTPLFMHTERMSYDGPDPQAGKSEDPIEYIIRELCVTYPKKCDARESNTTRRKRSETAPVIPAAVPDSGSV